MSLNYGMHKSNNKRLMTNKKSKWFKVGDYVRISCAKKVFAKGYEKEWTEEIFVIKEVITRPTSPVTYKLQDYEGIPIEGVFYHEEVQRVAKPEVFSVEKVLRTKIMPDGSKQHLVKWLGYKQPTWTSSDIMKKIVMSSQNPIYCFFVDYETVCDGWIKSIVITNMLTKHKVILEMQKPLDWSDIIFKQMNRKHYYENPEYLNWQDGYIAYDDWIQAVLEVIDPERDIVYVNNERKRDKLMSTCGLCFCFCCV